MEKRRERQRERGREGSYTPTGMMRESALCLARSANGGLRQTLVSELSVRVRVKEIRIL